MTHIDIVFDGPPGPVAGRFVEVEDASGKSISFGEWLQRPDGYWVLRMEQPPEPAPAVATEAGDAITRLEHLRDHLSWPQPIRSDLDAAAAAIDQLIKLIRLAPEPAGIWVLTFEVNAYDQEGEYFERAWDHKPSEAELLAAKVKAGDVAHVLAGGGRRGVESQWQHLRKQSTAETKARCQHVPGDYTCVVPGCPNGPPLNGSGSDGR